MMVRGEGMKGERTAGDARGYSVGRATGRLAAAVSVLALAACAVTPERLTEADVRATVEQDVSRMFVHQEPVSGPVTMYEAMARAIKYNLDHRLKVMEEALGAAQLTSANLDMLPRLTANAGYSGRDNFMASRSRNLESGTPGDPYSTSQDRDVRNADLTMTWNVLDFGVSYMRAKQTADRALIMEERRRKVVHNIIQDVRDAYWNAHSADMLLRQIDPMLERVSRALASAREIEQRRLQPPVEALTYRRDLLEILRQLTQLRRDLASAKTRLAALMNLPMGTTFSLGGQTGPTVAPDLQMDVGELERLALVHRPEMREELYQQRISRSEVRRAMLQMLPGINLNSGYNWSSNSFAMNQDWTSWGASITGNLFDLVAGPQRIAAAEAQADVIETRRMALAMAVMSQVHVSWLDYREALSSHGTAEELAAVERELLVQTRNAERTRAQGELEEIRAELRALVSDLRRDMAFSAVRSALGRVFLSVGADPLPEEVTSHDVSTLAQALEDRFQTWLSGQLDFIVEVPGSEGDPARVPEATSVREPIAPVDSALAPMPAPALVTPALAPALAQPVVPATGPAMAANPVTDPVSGAVGMVAWLGDLLVPPAPGGGAQ